jgi:hypothetical protein
LGLDAAAWGFFYLARANFSKKKAAAAAYKIGREDGAPNFTPRARDFPIPEKPS